MDTYTIIGDPHVKPNNLELFSELTSKVEKLGNPTIWLGDLLDTKEVVRGKCLNAWYNYFKGSPLQHTVLVGNHDFFNLKCEAHSLEVLKSLSNVNVVDRVQHSAGGFGFLPYIHEQKDLKKALKSLIKDGVHTVFGHLELKGFDFGNGYICDDGLTEKDFSKFKMVISGHFHKYQNSKNVTYLGTPFSHSFGESNQIKYIGVLKEGKLELIPTGFPQHLTHEINADDPKPTDLGENDIHRIILTGSQENIDLFNRANYDKFNVKWMERPSDTAANIQISDTQSNEVQFAKWGEDVASLDPETIKLGLQILGAFSD